MTWFVERQGTERLSALTNARVSCWREPLHAAAVARVGGERSRIPAAVSLSMTIIGAPHLGQSRGLLASLAVDSSCSVCCGEPSTKRQECGASAIGQESEAADAHEAFRKHVQEEAAREFIDRKSQQLTKTECHKSVMVLCSKTRQTNQNKSTRGLRKRLTLHI
jgi:hypothetical protein